MLIHKHLIVTGHYNTKRALRNVGKARLRDLINELLEELDMKILSGPYTSRCDDEGNEGYTMMTAITTSHIILHTWDNGHFQLDIYSCKKYSVDKVLEVLKKHNFYSKKEQLIDRPFVKKDS